MGREWENRMDKQAYLAQIDRVIAAGPYKADWGTLLPLCFELEIG